MGNTIISRIFIAVLLILSVLKYLAVGTPHLERNESRGLLPAQPPMRFDCNLCCNT